MIIENAFSTGILFAAGWYLVKLVVSGLRILLGD